MVLLYKSSRTVLSTYQSIKIVLCKTNNIYIYYINIELIPIFFIKNFILIKKKVIITSKLGVFWRTEPEIKTKITLKNFNCSDEQGLQNNFNVNIYTIPKW
jgi:hypothetical protein